MLHAQAINYFRLFGAMCNFPELPTLREASYTPFLNALWAIPLSQSGRGAKARSVPLLPQWEKGLGDEGKSLVAHGVYIEITVL